MPNSLLIVQVDVAVVPEQVDTFLEATVANATASRQEPGVVRFDVLSDRDDAGHVVLVEVYPTSRPPLRTRTPRTTGSGETPWRR